MGSLEGKVAIITGGAGGIGRATAELYVQAGATVVLVDVSEPALQDAVNTVGGAVSYIVADVTDDEHVRGCIERTVGDHGRLDVLFANAGIEGVVKPIVEYPMDVYDQVIAVNLRGVYSVLRHGIPAIAEGGGGSIIITSSIAGLHGFAGLSPYVISKHGLVGLMRSAVLECGTNGVRINTIHPSPVNTRMMRSIEEGAAPGAGDVAIKEFEAMIPVGRYGEPDEVGRLAVFLGSDESRFITGASISIDGGMSVA